MRQARRWILGAALAAGAVTGALLGTADPAQAQGILRGTGPYSPSGTSMPVSTVPIGQYSAVGVDPPYNSAMTGIPQGVDIQVTHGNADAASPVIGQFPLTFMTAPVSR